MSSATSCPPPAPTLAPAFAAPIAPTAPIEPIEPAELVRHTADAGGTRSLGRCQRVRPAGAGDRLGTGATIVALVGLAALLGLAPAPASATCDPLCAGPTLAVRELLGRAPERNALKLYSAAVDDTRHRLYVAGALTSAIAVYDTQTNQFVGWLDGGVSGELTHKFLFVDEVANDLWIADSTLGEVRRIDLDTGTLAGPVAIGPFFGHAVVDSERRRLIVASSESPSMRAIDGATLATAWSTNALGAGTGALALDRATDTVFVVDLADRGTTRQIHRLRATDGGTLSDLDYTADNNSRSVAIDRDTNTGELWIGNSRKILVVGPNGGTLRSTSIDGFVFSDGVFASDQNRYFALIELPAEGDEADTAASEVWVYDRTTLARLATLPTGRKTHRMVHSAAEDLLYAPNGDLSTVWQASTASLATPAPLRLGESLEGIVPAADGLVYTSSRLGGSEVHVIDPALGTADWFASGTWPYPVLGNAAKDELYVLDFWDSTLSVYDLLPSRTLTARIPIGLPRGTSDRLPDLALDETRGLAFAALPEYGKVAVVDLAAEAALTPISVPNFPAGELGGGPGDLQLAVAPAAGILFVLASDQQQLHRFDLDAGRVSLGAVSLLGLDWNWAGNVADRNALWVDETRGVLFVGPHELALASGQPTGRRLAGNRQVLGARLGGGADELWAYGRDSDAASFRAQPVSFATLASTGTALDLGIPETLVFTPYLDPATGTLWIGDQVDVELTAYTTEEPTEPPPCVPTSTAICLQSDRFRITATFQRPTDAQASAAQTVELTPDTGYLWFFRADNVELILKVLDGRGVNGKFWVFLAPLSNVAWTVTVEDTATGAVRTYANPQAGITVVNDTSAF
jgi:DNA-binding beta-propeller fold protein YncE